jgi:hypothetical protein
MVEANTFKFIIYKFIGLLEFLLHEISQIIIFYLANENDVYIFFKSLNYDVIKSINKITSLHTKRDNPVCSIYLVC